MEYFDYKTQSWIVDGRYARCGHQGTCSCYGRLHEGELATDIEARYIDPEERLEAYLEPSPAPKRS